MELWMAFMVLLVVVLVAGIVKFSLRTWWDMTAPPDMALHAHIELDAGAVRAAYGWVAIRDEQVVAGDAAVITGPPKELERDAVVAVLIHTLDWCAQSGEVKAGERAKIAIDHPFAPLMAERAFGSVRAGRRRRFLHPDEYWALQELRDALEEQEIRFEITAYDKAPRQAAERAAAVLSRAGDPRPGGNTT